MTAPMGPSGLDRYELCERAVIALGELLETMDPTWSAEWEHVCRHATFVDVQLHLLWRMLRQDRLRYERRLP